MEVKRHKDRWIRHYISAPFIWLNIIPIIIADAFLEMYHQICFPLYEIPLVDRNKYIKIDRHKLKYLSPGEKINCMYCGYVNGWLQYATKIAGDTEKYWCGIKHQQNNNFVAPAHHKNFPDYGDEQAFVTMYEEETVDDKESSKTIS